MRKEQRREETAWAIRWLIMPHCGENTPSVEAILGREQPASRKANAVDFGDGITVSGDPALVAALLRDGI